MKIIFISSFVPRKCGIATYTRDLASALKKEKTGVSVIAIKNKLIKNYTDSLIMGTIEEQNLSDYIAAADTINKEKDTIVHIQHEFGLYGGENGDYILSFAQRLTIPFVVTFHTVLHNPSPHQKYIMKELARLSSQMIVMSEVAKERLTMVYGFSPREISIIYHGVPSLQGLEKNKVKQELHLEKSYMLLISNLLSRNKGIEYAIKAMPEIVRKIPHAKLIIAGETHPNILSQEGETYREELEKLTAKLHMTKFVVFKNEYLSLEMLSRLLIASDICLTPYLDPEQITSGTLSYAVGAGKVCISTPYIHAEQLLSQNVGILVPFRNSRKIAQAVIEVYSNDQKREKIEIKAMSLGEKMQWKHVAKEHMLVYKTLLKTKIYTLEGAYNILKQTPNISYLELLTDHVGITQHTFYSIPEGKFGYSVDDSARALIVVVALYKKYNLKIFIHLAKIYLSYIRFAQEKNGLFHNFLNIQKEWIDEEKMNDSFGRVMWALGFSSYALSNTSYSRAIDALFSASMIMIYKIIHIRCAANTILGLYYYIQDKQHVTKKNRDYVMMLGDMMTKAYKKNASTNWQWFENKMTYDNFRLPLALFAAYKVTEIEKYLVIAEESLLFAEKNNFDEVHNYFDFIGQDGWLIKGKKKATFDQQVLEAGSAVESYIFAYEVTGKKKYLQKAFLAFAWFLGWNRNKRMLYDPTTGGVFDGLTQEGLNENQGAESVISFLIAWIFLKDYSEEIKQ